MHAWAVCSQAFNAFARGATYEQHEDLARAEYVDLVHFITCQLWADDGRHSLASQHRPLRTPPDAKQSALAAMKVQNACLTEAACAAEWIGVTSMGLQVRQQFWCYHAC